MYPDIVGLDGHKFKTKVKINNLENSMTMKSM